MAGFGAIWRGRRAAGWVLCLAFAASASEEESVDISGGVPPTAPGATALVVAGVTRPTYNALLGFMLPGVVEEIGVAPGQAVRSGDLLLRLDARAETHRLAALDREIANTIQLRTLRTRINQAKLDKERYAQAFIKGAATEMEVQHAALAYDLSLLALEEEEFRLEQLKHSREELLAVLDRMRLAAPHDGYAEEILVELGMTVDRNVPALRLVAIDPMQIDLTLPLEAALHLKAGANVDVLRPGGAASIPGTVAQVARIAVLSNRTLKVRVQAPNPDHYPAGLSLRVRFPGLPAMRDLAPETVSGRDFFENP